MINGVEHETGKEEEILPFEEDDYGGVIVEMKTPMDPKCFIATLRYSLTQWRLQVCAWGDHTHLSLPE